MVWQGFALRELEVLCKIGVISPWLHCTAEADTAGVSLSFKISCFHPFCANTCWALMIGLPPRSFSTWSFSSHMKSLLPAGGSAERPRTKVAIMLRG